MPISKHTLSFIAKRRRKEAEANMNQMLLDQEWNSGYRGGFNYRLYGIPPKQIDHPTARGVRKSAAKRIKTLKKQPVETETEKALAEGLFQGLKDGKKEQQSRFRRYKK